MNRKNAISALGYAIVFVIIIGIVMIISAPMLVDKYKSNNVESYETNVVENNYENDYATKSDLQNLENNLNSSITELQNNNVSQDKYVCTIEGYLGDDGNIIDITLDTSDIKSKKFVFVCEYKN